LFFNNPAIYGGAINPIKTMGFSPLKRIIMAKASRICGTLFFPALKGGVNKRSSA
jgi:hypothetical protein